MIPKRRSPYASAVFTSIETQTEYPSPTPEYPSAPSAPATSASAPNYYGNANAGGAVASSISDQNTPPTSTSTAVPVAHLEISTPSQGAIIAISVICGLLLIALLFVILVFIGKRYEREKMTFEIGAGGGGGGSHRRRKHRSEKSYAEYGDVGRWRGFDPRRPFDPAFFRAGPDPGLNRNVGVPPGYVVDPRMQNLGSAAQPPYQRDDVEEVEGLSEVSSTRAEGTRTSKSGSERGHRSSKSSRSHRRGHHRGV